MHAHMSKQESLNFVKNVGEAVKTVKPGDRMTVNVETFVLEEPYQVFEERKDGVIKIAIY